VARIERGTLTTPVRDIRKDVPGQHSRCSPPGLAGWGCAVSRLAWTDPAPLEVERPRLPWWTLLPRRFLLAVSPVIVVVVLISVLVFLARRVWRYPLFLIGGTILAGLGVGYSWWTSAGVLAGLGAAGGLWAWGHRDSFDRIAARQVRSEWRCAFVYAWALAAGNAVFGSD
jgi:DNA segregation ATPase FtsK/SpoIIIE, S-DNA-T family